MDSCQSSGDVIRDLLINWTNVTLRGMLLQNCDSLQWAR